MFWQGRNVGWYGKGIGSDRENKNVVFYDTGIGIRLCYRSVVEYE